MIIFLSIDEAIESNTVEEIQDEDANLSTQPSLLLSAAAVLAFRQVVTCASSTSSSRNQVIMSLSLEFVEKI